ncbi:RHS repeat-associated core domain-containing protein [Streptomyces montanisoli]|uniref:RHS repeat-associated core domain-containing protein n=1 Tax=Streptomyces montanisoli TaxID=2798581 RepID=UPI001FD7FF03|nr:RHS repeat-associated core domain-containing protein [Streptomyces montanisoli]
MGRPTATYDTTGGAAPSSSNELTSHTYDTLKKGMPTSSTSYSAGAAYVSKTLGYDSHGWPQATSLVIPSTPDNGSLAGTYIQQSTYNLTGTVHTLTDTAAGSLPQRTLLYGYNTFGEPTSVAGSPGWSYVNKLTYTEFGEPQQFTYGTSGNFAQQTLQYDDQTRRLKSSLTETQSGHAIADNTSYTYQPSGNITRISDKLDDGTTDTQCFTYDWAQRLSAGWTSATAACASSPSASSVGGPAAYWKSWTYNDTGDRAKQVDHDLTGVTTNDATTTYTDEVAGKGPAHGLASANTTVPSDPTKNTDTTYTYDADGNTRTRTSRTGTDTFTYDTSGQLSELNSTGTSGDTKYVYDADGNLLIRRGPSDTVLFTQDEEVTLKHGDTTASAVRYITLAGQVVATETSDGKIAYVIPDRQGTGDLEIDSQTQAISRRQYTPFGAVRTSNDDWTGTRGYVGGQQDDTTGLTNLGAREYDPSAGRFLSVDPVLNSSDPESWNAYAYADNNPTTESDPSGECPPDRCGSGIPYADGSGRIAKSGPVDPDNSGSVHCGTNGMCSDGRKWDDNRGHPGSGGSSHGGSSAGRSSSSGKSVSNTTSTRHAEAQAAARKKASATAVLTAAKKQKEGFTHRIINLIADFVGVTDAVNCFTKGDVWGCINTALNAVPWGKAFEAIKVGYKAYKVWRQFEKAEAAVQDAEESVRAADKVLRAATCPVHSFVGTTAVQLADGTTKPISKLKAGDTVEATDPQTGVTAPEKVDRLIVTKTDHDFTDVKIAGTHGKAAVLTTTWHHPFWDATHHRWTDADHLAPGTRLRQADGSTATVLAVRNYQRYTTTYDLTVDRIHTYYVLAGETPVLVHNATPGQKCDLTLGAGPNAREGVALENGDIEADGVRDLINESGNAHGCHTCDATTPGTKYGDWIPDHQPPSSLVAPGSPQTAYPHCWPCARRQAGVVSQLSQARSKKEW